MTRTDIINKIIADNSYQSYLEIGLSNPEKNFLKINCATKESCVPFDATYNDGYYDENLVKQCLTYDMTSDDMFAQMPEDKKYDIIFIDGLHLEEHVDKDIFNSLKHINDNGCIVVHDCLPSKEIEQLEERQTSVWNGSVWKSITKLGIYGIKYIVVDADYGVGIIKKGEMKELPPLSKLKWQDFEKKRDTLMHVVSEGYFLTTPSTRLWDNYYEQFYEIRLNEDFYSRLYHRDNTDKDKYLVFTCAKNENEYIKEWIEHYLKLGFDKIIICDNNDDDVLENLLSQYISNGTVELFDFRRCASFQVQMYSVFAQYSNYKWCGYFDCDEFLELNCYDNIKEFLETIKEDCVSFNWLVYGSNGNKHKEEGGVQERFKEPVYPICMFKENMFIKSIVRGCDNFKKCWFNGSHVPMYCNVTYNIGGYYLTDNSSHEEFPPRYKLGYIKHYYTKSFDEWITKAQRGWPDGTVNLNSANFFICENTTDVPIDMYKYGFFSCDEVSPWVKDILKEYDVINVTNSSKRVYPWLIGLIKMFMHEGGHTYVITDAHIDETLYNICFEYAIKTGNNLVFARNYDEVWRAYLKYNKGKNGTYYILDLQ